MKDYNQIAITTKSIINGTQPIEVVYHDADGDWQFLPGQEISEEDATVISIAQILRLDPTVKDVLAMPRSNKSFRIAPDKWIQEKI